MTASVIPPSPSREDYARDYAAALAANGDETIFARIEPIGLFVDWLADARAHEPNDPNAMTLSTVDADGLPDARIVLLKDVDARGFTFYSNAESAKADIVRQLLAGNQEAPADAANRLAYSLDQPHTALLLWLTGLDHETSRMFGFSAMAEEIATTLQLLGRTSVGALGPDCVRVRD